MNFVARDKFILRRDLCRGNLCVVVYILGRPLPTLCFHLFHEYGLMNHFRLDPVRVWKFFSELAL